MKRINALNLMTLLTILCLTLLAVACGSVPEAPPPTSTATPAVPTPAVPTLEVSATDEAGDGSTEKSVQDLTAEDLAKIVAERTPEPSPTPDRVDVLVKQVTAESGLAGKTFLGLRAEDWINLGASILFVLIASLLVIPLLFGLLNWAVRRTKTQFDDDFLATIGPELRWLVVIFMTALATLRLGFLSDTLRLLLEDLFFLLMLGVITITAVRLVSFAADHYLDYLKSEADRKRWGPIMTTLKRLGYVFVSLIALGIVAIHFGIDVAVPSVVLLLVAGIFVLAARTTIDDAVGGFIILILQHFRVGDDILIKDLNTTGDVVEIGLLATILHTRDNRVVIIPNSQISQSQVVNYSYPDPSFRVQTDIGVAYGTDIDLMEQVITEIVRGIEGVLPDKPTNVFFLAFGDSTLQVRVQWWVESVNHRNRMLHRVNAALQLALAEAGIDMPIPTYDLNLKIEDESNGRATQTLFAGSTKGSS